MTTTTESPSLSGITPPTRFRRGEQRAAAIGRVLKVVGRVKAVDEDLVQLAGERFMACDELGAELAVALRAKGPDRVTMQQFQVALCSGIAAVPDAPPALQAFFDGLENTPEWVDFDLVNEGARVYRRLGRNASDVLLQLALIGGYRFGGPTDLLVATGGLTGDTTRRRLGETQKWGIAVSQHDAMLRGGEGWKLTVHVRLMHALVNHHFTNSDQWDTGHWGLPINATDQAATLGLFDGALLIGARALGTRITRAESDAVMHLWKYIGWLMGVEEDWLVDTERERHYLNYHILLAQDDVSEAGRALATSIVSAQPDLFNQSTPFGRVYGWFMRERLLSMLRVFLGTKGLADLGLERRLGWAFGGVFAKNVVKYWIIGRFDAGERYLQWSSRKNAERLMRRYFGDDEPSVAHLSS